jgi:hypothetical protein
VGDLVGTPAVGVMVVSSVGARDLAGKPVTGALVGAGSGVGAGDTSSMPVWAAAG